MAARPSRVLLAHEARSATWLWGSRAAAARRLNVSPRTLGRLEAGRPISDQIERRLSSAMRRLSSNQRQALRGGDAMLAALSDQQRAVLKRQGFKGQKFAKAVRQFRRLNLRWSRQHPGTIIGGIIEEAYT